MYIPKGFRKKTKKGDLEKLLSQRYNALHVEHGVKNDRRDLVTFDNSLKILKKNGYDRHFMSWECFDLFIGYFEGKVGCGDIVEQMLQSYGEWFNMAIRRVKDRLFCYTNPRNIKWDEGSCQYFVDGDLEFDSLCSLKLSNFDLIGRWVNLESFDHEFVKFFYGREFEDLPSPIRKDNPKFYLPKENVVKPIGRGYGSKFSIATFDKEISRGVRKIKV